MFSKTSMIAGAIAGVVATIVVVVLVNWLVIIPNAKKEGRDRYIAEQAVADQKSELERKGDDATLQRLSDYDLCVAAIGRVPECDSLKLQPVREEQPISEGDGSVDPSR